MIKRLTAVDGLRGCAVIMVLALHFTSQVVQPAFITTALIKKLCSFGWIGVDLFFVISGFLITSLLCDARGQNDYFAGFYCRRALRILPLYYGLLLCLFSLPLLLDSPDAIRCRTPWHDQLWYWLHLQNFHTLPNGLSDFVGHLWSLAIEEQFYFVWPLVVLLPGRWPLNICAGCLVVGFGIRLVGVCLLSDVRILYFCTFTRLDGLAVGSAIALLARSDGGLAKLDKITLPIAVSTLIVLAILTAQLRWLDPGAPAVIVFGYLAVSLLFGAFLVRALNFPGRRLGAALDFRILRFFGKYSYALYVFHVPVIVLLKRAGLAPVGFMGVRSEFVGLVGYCLLCMCLTVGCALLSWHLWERHFLWIKYRLFPRSLAP